MRVVEFPLALLADAERRPRRHVPVPDVADVELCDLAGRSLETAAPRRLVAVLVITGAVFQRLATTG